MICFNCQAVNSPEARFCMNCGSKLPGSSSKPPEGEFPLPGSVRREAEPASKALSGERRILTVLFTDVVGSTALAEKMDPEDWTVVMNRAFDRLVPVVFQYEGTVARLQGDSLLAFFGAPVAHEDDPIRAAHAALDMLAAIREYARVVLEAYRIEFAIRVGLTTGPVVVGEVGSRQASEYTAMGDAVNLAARLQAAASPMTAWTSESTYPYIAHLFECFDLGEMQLRGKSEAVRVYELRGRKPQPEAVRGLAGTESPLIGRHDELQDLLRTSQVVLAGLGRAALVIGEAGVGKSRLVREWRASARDGLRWVQGRSLSYGQGMPYHLAVDWIKNLTGLSPGASAEELQAVFAEVGWNGAAQAEERLFFLHLLDLPLSPEQQNLLDLIDPQALQAGYQAMLEGLLISYSQKKPLIVILDDLQWCDPSSADLLSRALKTINQAPILFCLVTRNDPDAPGWKLVEAARLTLQSDLVEIPIQSLSDEESRQLVANFLGTNLLPDELDSLVFSKAEGNPLFIEEMLRMLVDQAVLVQDEGGWQVRPMEGSLVLPGSLLGLLQARIDRLPPATRQVLKVAAVIGRQFQSELLKLVLEKSNPEINFEEQLHNLESARFIRRLKLSGIEFRHTLLQEAVYASLLKVELRSMHLAIAEALERISEKSPQPAVLLAYHFSNAGDERRAVKYYTQAGEWAASQYAIQEALEYYRRAIEYAHNLDRSAAALYNARGKIFETSGQFDAAIECLLQALQAARAYGEAEIELQCLLNLGFAWSARDYTQAGEYFQQALVLAGRLEEPRSLAQALNRVGNWYTNIEQIDLAKRYQQEALAIYQELGDQQGIAQSLDLIGMNASLGNEPDLAWEGTESAVALFRKINDLPGLASSLPSLALGSEYFELGASYLRFQPYSQTRAYVEEALEICRRIHWASGEAFALAVLSSLETAQGEYRDAALTAQEGLRIASKIGHLQWMTANQFGLIVLRREMLAYEAAQQLIETTLPIAQKTGSLHWIGFVQSEAAFNFILQGQLEQAESVLNPALQGVEIPRTISKRNLWLARALLETARQNSENALAFLDSLASSGNPRDSHHAAIYISLARGNALAASARWEEARREFQGTLEIVIANHFLGMVWRCQAALGIIYEAQGQTQAAAEARRQARKIVALLAEKITDKPLRASFEQRAAEKIRQGTNSWPGLIF